MTSQLATLLARSRAEVATRAFFAGQGFVETRTSLLVPSPGMEPHIRPLTVGTWAKEPFESAVFLPTSPEFSMKKILSTYAGQGLEKIYQLTPAFRHEPVSSTHLPEFTMLEWYRVGGTTADLMEDVRGLIAAVSGLEVKPLRVRTTRDLFLEFAEFDLRSDSPRESLEAVCRRLGLKPDATDTWDDLYFKIWLNAVEPRIPTTEPLVVTKYPVSQAALAELVEDEFGKWANRFEIYWRGYELANAFQELTDVNEQRRRFQEDMELRARTYGPDFPETPLDIEFLKALETFPKCAGIALGFDRLVMAVTGAKDIRDVQWWGP